MLICAKCFTEMKPEDSECGYCGHRPTEQDVFKTRYGEKDLTKLGLSEKLIAFVMTEPRQGIFTYRCEEKYGGWPSHVPEDVTAVYPLWSCNGDLTVVWIRAGHREFVRLYHDDPDVTLLARSEQGLLAKLFLPLMEGLSWNDATEVAASEKKLVEASATLNFKYIGEFIELYARSGDDPDGYTERINHLMSEIDQQEI
jgi:hypothetical protein